MSEGKNREIRRICAHLGWPVSRLIRVSFGPFELEGLEAGAVEEGPAGSIENEWKGSVCRKVTANALSGRKTAP